MYLHIFTGFFCNLHDQFAAMDIDKNGYIDYNEFTIAMTGTTKARHFNLAVQLFLCIQQYMYDMHISTFTIVFILH